MVQAASRLAIAYIDPTHRPAASGRFHYTSGMSLRSALRPALRPTRRKLGFTLAFLLLVLIAHLVVIEWLRHELPLLALVDDDDDSIVSISLQALPETTPPPEPPVMPKIKELPPPKATDTSEPVAAVPVTDTPVAAVPEAPTPQSEAPAGDALASDAISVAASGEPAADAAAEASAPTAAPALFERVSLPPSAELIYTVVGVRNGSRMTGHGKIRWQHDGQRYTLSGEVGVLVFTLLSYKSTGEVGQIGLAPTVYAEKRIGRSQTNTHFHRERNSISFSASTAAYPVKGGEQDRSSWIWQLASLGRGDPDKFEAGLVFDISVAGHKSLDGWRVYVNGRENVELPQGQVGTWRLSVIPGENSFERQFDLWLAPERDWYPVMLRHVDKAGNSVEMLLADTK